MRTRIAALIAEARDEHGADLVLFPELALQRLSAGRPVAAAGVPRRLRSGAATHRRRHAWHRRRRRLAAGGGRGGVQRRQRAARRRASHSTYRKRELPNYAVFDERRYFDVDPDGDDCVFEVEGVTRRPGDLRGPVVRRTAGVDRRRRARNCCWCRTHRRSSATSMRSAMR